MNRLAAAWDRFFFDFTISRGKLELFRIVFFALFGLDAFLQIEHAPRYGAGDFNVAHFTFIDQLVPLPSRFGMMVVYLLQSYLGFRIMAGVTVRRSMALLTALFGYAYFISQVDSYQHHYLVFLILFLFNFLPWDEADARGDPAELLPSWATRLVLVQLSFLYVWAGVAKLDGHWLKGETLQMQVPDSWLRGVFNDVASGLGIPTLTFWGLMAWGVALAELALGPAIHIRRLWPLLVPFGVVFHGGIEFSGYKIGLFSYFMIAFYILLIPEGWLGGAARFFSSAPSPAPAAVPAPVSPKKGRRGAAPPPAEAPAAPPVVGIRGGWWELAKAVLPVAVLLGLASQADRWDRVEYLAELIAAIFLLSIAIQYYPGRWLAGGSWALTQRLGLTGVRGWVWLAACVGVGSGLLWIMPFHEAPIYVVAVGLIALLFEIGRSEGRVRSGLAHLLACLLVLGCHLSTTAALDYYRYMGGDARRRGDLPTAIRAYTTVTEIDPEYASGFGRLGDLRMRTAEYDLAAEAYRQASRLAPDDGGYLVALAGAHDRAGHGPEALSAARSALQMRLDEKERRRAQQIVARWSSGGGAPASAAPDDPAPDEGGGDE